MRTRIGFIRNRIAAGIGQAAGPGNDLPLRWVQVTGGTVDPGTDAVIGGSSQMLSGVVRALALQEAATVTVRQYQEIAAGDLIVDLMGNPSVSLYEGQPQSGVVTLDSIAANDLEYYWAGSWYGQAKVGSDLAAVWAAQAAGVELHRTILLKKST